VTRAGSVVINMCPFCATQRDDGLQNHCTIGSVCNKWHDLTT
jgi:hypothetical protein